MNVPSEQFGSGAGRSRHLLQNQKARWGIAFVTPILIFLLVFMLYPIVSVFRYSLTSWDGISAMHYIGLQNYRDILTSLDFWRVIKNNFIFLILGVPIWTIFPLLIALLLYDDIAGHRFFQTVFLLPTVLSAAIIGVLVRGFFDYEGPINAMLNAIGLHALAIQWLAQGSTSIPIIALTVNWAGFGSAILIFLSGMAAIDPSMYEAVYLDGANWWQRVFYITLPMINNIVQFVIVLNIISAFTALFNYVFVITNGGPGYQSTVIEFLIYLKAFQSNQFGYACALAAILFLIVLIISRLQLSVTKQEDWRE